MQDNAQEVAEAEQEGDKAGTKVQAAVEKEDDDFDPEDAEADEGEPIGDDEADDAGELYASEVAGLSNLCGVGFWSACRSSGCDAKRHRLPFPLLVSGCTLASC